MGREQSINNEGKNLKAQHPAYGTCATQNLPDIESKETKNSKGVKDKRRGDPGSPQVLKKTKR